MKKTAFRSSDTTYANGMKRLLEITYDNTPRIPLEPQKIDESEGNRKNTCILCGYIWNSKIKKPKRCPACSSTRWNNNEMKKRVCKQCSHRWMSKPKDPIMCPSCKSKLWNKKIGHYICEKCSHSWSRPLNKNPPKRCPACQAACVKKGIVKCICKKCRYTGVMDSDRQARCPFCKTPMSLLKTIEAANSWHKGKGIDPIKVPEIEKILTSDVDDTKKMLEIIYVSTLDDLDAEILVRFFRYKDVIKVARDTEASLHRVAVLTNPFYDKVVGAEESEI